MIEVEGAKVSDYEDFYGFDEVEARLREIAVYIQAAESHRLGTGHTEELRDQLRIHFRRQRLVIKKAIETLNRRESKIGYDWDQKSLHVYFDDCKRRIFCKMIVHGANDLPTENEQIEYVRRLLKVRLKSLDVHQATARRFFKRLDALLKEA